MKKILIVAVLLVVGTVFLLGRINVVLLVNGNLGDRSFFDSAAAGMEKMRDQLGATVKIIEMNYNPAEWEPALDQVCEQGIYDLVIVGTSRMVDILSRIAPLYPDQRFVLYDASLDFSTGAYPNVFSLTYRQNEGSFLAGVLAAMTSDHLGFLGGMDMPVVNDFLVGYVQGARWVSPGLEVVSTYAGAYNDPAKGKEFALAMYRGGVDVVFAVAGQTGNGVYEAAKEAGAWAIGVDSDVQMLYAEKDMGIVEHVLGSMVKDIGQSLFLVAQRLEQGNLGFGQNQSMGLSEGVVGLADNPFFRAFLGSHPEVERALQQARQQILEGTITVQSALGMSEEQLK
ncbi:MAG TPA: BMP family ABC transporter substrate-binding protein, partial [Thermotogota bacterium]|nr:BMP family ABC transporter substrate-binding protein [Thermotogota bacterium]